MSKPMLRAVRLTAPVKAPCYKECPDCAYPLQYWKGGNGFVWLCPKCRKVKENI